MYRQKWPINCGIFHKNFDLILNFDAASKRKPDFSENPDKSFKFENDLKIYEFALENQ